MNAVIICLGRCDPRSYQATAPRGDAIYCHMVEVAQENFGKILFRIFRVIGAISPEHQLTSTSDYCSTLREYLQWGFTEFEADSMVVLR